MAKDVDIVSSIDCDKLTEYKGAVAGRNGSSVGQYYVKDNEERKYRTARHKGQGSSEGKYDI